MTPAIIVGGIIGGLFTPTEASVVAVLYALILGVFIYRTLGWRQVPHVFYESARFAAISLFCIGTASAFGWLLAYFHVPQLFVDAVSRFGGGVTSVGLIVACPSWSSAASSMRSRPSSSSGPSSRRSPTASACIRSTSPSSA